MPSLRMQAAVALLRHIPLWRGREQFHF
jgi:hypothetical protein